MGAKGSFEKRILNGRTALAILLVAVVWRTFISLDSEIVFWESLCSGVALFIVGWMLFVYVFRLSRELTGWILTNYIYQGIAIGLAIINVYAVIYYVMRWYTVLYGEVALQPMDFIFRDVRYIALVLFYCAVIWSARYPKQMHEEYLSRSKEKTVMHLISPYLYPRVKKLKEMSVKELLGHVITDERTLLAIVGLAFLWRIVVSLDNTISVGENMASGSALIIIGWLFFAYVYSLPKKQGEWAALVTVYHSIALGILAINMYVLMNYGITWYGVSGATVEVALFLEYLLRDVLFIAFVMFYCASITLSKFLRRAYEEYSLLSSEGASPGSSQKSAGVTQTE
ncbi:MAG: hypothetical protein ACP5E9_06355 [Candidatus Methanospirareceae archaeon]